MTISPGDPLPETDFLVVGADGPEPFPSARLKTGKAVIVAMPGAYTRTCSGAHLPDILNNVDAIKARGVHTVAVVAVNDPFVMAAWGEATGATAAGITMLADPAGAFTKAVGLSFSAPPVGLIDRSQRYSMVVEDGKVAHLNIEEGRGTCDISGGRVLLEQL